MNHDKNKQLQDLLGDLSQISLEDILKNTPKCPEQIVHIKEHIEALLFESSVFTERAKELRAFIDQNENVLLDYFINQKVFTNELLFDAVTQEKKKEDKTVFLSSTTLDFEEVAQKLDDSARIVSGIFETLRRLEIQADTEAKKGGVQ